MISGFVPTNYFITKSMELTRERKSGTLWFTKKLIVYYTYIFLKNEYIYKDQANKITRIFEDYINSMPPELHSDARSFFFPSTGLNNPSSSMFRLFKDFAGTKNFNNDKEEKEFYQLAKKYYFAFLMETGGQGKLNSHIQASLYKVDFNMTQIEDVISSFYKGEVHDMTRRINDYMSSLRNDRQVLYYYGFFHSKSSGATDEEFSSLTSIGELALKANYYELMAIWEHQKMKMISQPVTISLDKKYLNGKSFDPKQFAINRDPYYTISSWLNLASSMSQDEYKYLVSRLKKPITNKKDIKELTNCLNHAINTVESFKRKSESREKTEDFTKEIKKYLLGIRSDLRHDRSTAPLGMVSYSGKLISVNNHKKLDLLNRVNAIVSQYKNKRYASLFDRCEKELRRQFALRQQGADYELDLNVKIEWDMYNMKIEVPIMILSMLLVCDKGRDELFSFSNPKLVAKALSDEMPNIMKYLGLSNANSRAKALIKLKEAISTEDYSGYEEHDEISYIPLITKYIEDSAADLDRKVKTESKRPTIMDGEKRKRNTTLVSVLKAYNIKCFGTSISLKCECCGCETFITRTDEMFMEYHHLIPFNEYDGPDHYLNLFALCPMCHRKIHLAKDTLRQTMYRNISENNYRKITIDNRLQELKKEGILKSYHLDYLFNENAISKDTYDQLSSAS